MDKVEISKLLDGFYGYPKTFVCTSLLAYKEAPLENKYYFIKAPKGSRSNTISFCRGRQLLIDRGGFKDFPVIIQEEISPKLDDGYKVDYRVWCLVVNKKPYLYKKCMVKKCDSKFSRQDPEGLFTNGLKNGRTTTLINTPKNFDPLVFDSFNLIKHKVPNQSVLGYDIIFDEDGKCWILEIEVRGFGSFNSIALNNRFDENFDKKINRELLMLSKGLSSDEFRDIS